MESWLYIRKLIIPSKAKLTKPSEIMVLLLLVTHSRKNNKMSSNVPNCITQYTQSLLPNQNTTPQLIKALLERDNPV